MTVMTNDTRFFSYLLVLCDCRRRRAAARPRRPRRMPPRLAASTVQDDDPDRDPNDAQPDFYVATLQHQPAPAERQDGVPPDASVPAHARRRRLRRSRRRAFSASIRGAQIGLDLKYAPFRGAQIGIYRTSDRTIQLQGQYNLIKDGNGPIGVGVGRQRRRHRQFQRRVLARRGDRAVARARRSRRDLPAAVVCRQHQLDQRRSATTTR